MAIQAVDWFVPEHHLSMYWFKVSFLRGVSPRSTDLGDCSQGFARSTGDVRQPGRLVSGGYPGLPRRLGKLMLLSAEEKGTFEKIGIHLISKKHN